MNNDLTAFFNGVAFTPDTVEPTKDFEVLPPGKYTVLVENAEVKQTKAGTGHYVKLTMTILDEEFKNRKVWDQINVQNPSTECTEIGMRTLSALGRAIGLQAITDTSQLMNAVVVAHVKVKDGQNNVRTYSSATQSEMSQQPAMQPPRMPQTQPAPPSALLPPKKKEPWAR